MASEKYILPNGAKNKILNDLIIKNPKKMKKTMTILGAFLFASTILTSCGGGNSPESDAKKLAELNCKAQKVAQKLASGDQSAAEESTKLAKEAADLAKELEGKYTSEADLKKYKEALEKENGNCK